LSKGKTGVCYSLQPGFSGSQSYGYTTSTGYVGQATEHANQAKIPTPSTMPILDAANTKCIQEIIGILLYYAQAVNSTLLAALGTIATQQAKGTKDHQRHHGSNHPATKLLCHAPMPLFGTTPVT